MPSNPLPVNAPSPHFVGNRVPDEVVARQEFRPVDVVLHLGAERCNEVQHETQSTDTSRIVCQNLP